MPSMAPQYPQNGPPEEQYQGAYPSQAQPPVAPQAFNNNPTY
jgi:hypothetical protein